MKNACILFTGGKDSVFALHRAIESGLDIRVLLTVIPRYKYSMLYHQPYFNGLISQAQALGIPLESIGWEEPGREEYALKTLLERAKKRFNVEVVVTGGIKSRFQQRVFSRIANELGLVISSPNWGIDEEEYMKIILDEGIRFIVISITSMGIPHSLLGKIFDRGDLDKLIKASGKYGFNISFEGGEAETFVIDAPMFKYRLEVSGRPIVLSEYEGYFDIEKIYLFKKR